VREAQTSGLVYRAAPKFNHFCTIKISVTFVPAVTALEVFVTSQPDVQAMVAGLRSIGWWDSNYLNTLLDSLVLKESS